MYFAITCFDRPGSAQLRGKHVPAHLRYLEAQGAKVHTGGPLKDPLDGRMVGSLYIIDAADYGEARAFIENEPLHKAGLFESMMVRGWQQMQPEITPGANELTAQSSSASSRKADRSSVAGILAMPVNCAAYPPSIWQPLPCDSDP